MSGSDTLSVIQIILRPLLYVGSLFNELMENTHMLGVWRAGVAIFMVCRFILAPIVGGISLGSDTAKKKGADDSKPKK